MLNVAVKIAREYAAQYRTLPSEGDEDGRAWERELMSCRRCFLMALSDLSDEDASRVIAENPGLEPDGETTFPLASIEDVQATRHAITEAHEIQRAILAARERTGDTTISPTLRRGKNQLVSVTFGPSGKANVVAISPWLPVGEFIAYVNAYSGAA